jgi:hypothetical protein
MKLQITLFIFLIFLKGFETSHAQSSENICPEIDDLSIFIIHGLLLANPELGLNIYSSDKNKISIESLRQKPDLPSYLRSYWKDKGVIQIADSNICNKISNTLDAKKKNRALMEKFNRIYYKADDKYLVIYTPKKSGTGPSKSPSSLILDREFNRIGEIGLRLKKSMN